jgi:TrmH family RNA methyltransferase
MITSNNNPKIKYVRALQAKPQARRQAQAFVCEGVRLLEEALSTGWPARLLLHTTELNERGQILVNAYASQGVEVEQVAPHVMRAASETETPQGILAVLVMQVLPITTKPDFVLIADAVRDPGNLGTILRTAVAAGVNALLMSPGTADPYAPKVLRSAMGAHFRLPLQVLSWQEIGNFLKGAGLRVYLAAVGQGEVFTRLDLRQPLALILGSEAEGAGSQAYALADTQVHIPIAGRSESLNVAAAAAVLMFEVVRQRTLLA